jgi:hypothetical protein
MGPFRTINKAGRWLAMPGEAGLIMCAFPRKDWDLKRARGAEQNAFTAAVFNECMTGFEHQVAAHMVWEGLVMEGLAIERAIHDRYHPSRRNPWNEVEAGDHYARAMASYGVYLAACGFEYHGPKGFLAFAPRLTPQSFKGAFTASQGWGTFTQRIQNNVLTANIHLKHGTLSVQTIGLGTALGFAPKKASVSVTGTPVSFSIVPDEERVLIKMSHPAVLRVGGTIEVALS